eukprot:365390-Chlamydomonas_euryale.AAC.16
MSSAWHTEHARAACKATTCADEGPDALTQPKGDFRPAHVQAPSHHHVYLGFSVGKLMILHAYSFPVDLSTASLTQEKPVTWC